MSWLSAWGYILIAVVAAGVYAVASVLEQYEAGKQDQDKALRLSLMTSLVQRPLWITGFGLDIAGFGLQAWALAVGPVVIVQPLLVTSLLFALPLGVRYTGQRIGRREWTGAAIVSVALAVFVLLANVDKGDTTDVAVYKWLLASLIVGGLAALCVAVGWRLPPAAKAALWGSAGGLLWGIMAVYLQTTMDLIDEVGVLGVLETAYPYLVAVSGALGLLMSQSAFQTGKLAPSMATFSAIDPVVGVVLGIWLFGQRLHGDVIGREIGALVALAALIYGVVLLSASKLVAAGAGALDADDEMLTRSGGPSA